MVGPTKIFAMSKINLAHIPSCKNSAIPDIHRVNYRVACYKWAKEPIFELPKAYEDDHGWQRDQNGFIEPVWTLGPILPINLIDILETVEERRA